MEDEGERQRKNTFWLILPFIITSCFIILIVLLGLNSGEKGSFWYIALPGMVLCIFPCAKGVSLIIQANLKASALGATKETYSSYPELINLKRKIIKWWMISLLMGIVASLASMASVGVFSSGKPRDKTIPDISDRPDIRKAPLFGKYREERADTSKKAVPPPFIENSDAHKRLQFYDSLIRKLIPVPFLGMLAGAVFLIRALIGRWWKWKKIPLVWKTIPFIAIALFTLPIMLTFRIAERMNETIRAETLKFLNNLSDDAAVIINGKTIESPCGIISELATLSAGRSIKWPSEKRIRIQVVDAEYSLILELGRDSWLYNEYRVFYPGYHHTRINKIGTINTTIFDRY